MRRILISINPEHVENIIKGLKKYEYRTRVAKDDIESIIVYSTAPTKKVLAEVKITNILKAHPNVLWDMTKDFSGISQDFYNKYFMGRKIAYAYELGEITIFDQPKELIDFGLMHAPQSYVYINY